MTWVGCGGFGARRGSERWLSGMSPTPSKAGSRYGRVQLVLNAQDESKRTFTSGEWLKLDLELEIARYQSEALLRHLTVSSSWTT